MCTQQSHPIFLLTTPIFLLFTLDVDTNVSSPRVGWIRRTYIALIPTLIALWLLSGINKHEEHEHGIYWAGVFWAAFCVVFVAAVIFSAFVLVRALRASR
jgi:hypothetical protein